MKSPIGHPSGFSPGILSGIPEDHARKFIPGIPSEIPETFSGFRLERNSSTASGIPELNTSGILRVTLSEISPGVPPEVIYAIL